MEAVARDSKIVRSLLLEEYTLDFSGIKRYWIARYWIERHWKSGTSGIGTLRSFFFFLLRGNGTPLFG